MRGMKSSGKAEPRWSLHPVVEIGQWWPPASFNPPDLDPLIRERKPIKIRRRISERQYLALM